MNIELLRKFGEGLFTADGGKGHLRFESRTVVPAGSSGHGSSPVLGKKPICRQKSHLTMLFRFPEPALEMPSCIVISLVAPGPDGPVNKGPQVVHILKGPNAGKQLSRAETESAEAFQERCDAMMEGEQ
jgi:hypothetical protein